MTKKKLKTGFDMYCNGILYEYYISKPVFVYLFCERHMNNGCNLGIEVIYYIMYNYIYQEYIKRVF